MNCLNNLSHPKPFILAPLNSVRKVHLSFFYLFLIFLSFIAFLKPTHSLNAYEVNRVPNQIIVQYKDSSFSPLAEDFKPSTQDTSSATARSYKYSAIYPGRIDLVLIEGLNIHQLLETLKNDPNVEYVEPNYIKEAFDISFERSDLPNDSNFSRQWALNSSNTASGADIDFPEAQALSRKSTAESNKPIIIGIIDSTFAIEHPDLINQVWINEEEIPNNGIDDDNNGYIDDRHGFDFVNLSPVVIGSDNHGSHVAGICAAENNNQKGISGAFPDVQFIALACSIGNNSLSSAAILRAKEYLIQLKNRGYNIVAANASYGSNIYSQLDYESLKDLSDNGILFCTASGNDSWNLDLETDPTGNGDSNSGEDTNGNGILEVSYPNSYDLPNIISVASLKSNLQLASSSNYGSTEVDIAAPGESIYATLNLDYLQEAQEITLSNGRIIANQLIDNASNISGESLTAPIYHCGIGYIEDFPQEASGYIALIERGTLLFSNKVTNAMIAGAIAVIIYNNIEEYPNGLRPWALTGTSTTPWIPSFSISQADGNAILDGLPLSATLKPYNERINPLSSQYGYLSGTSMASPFVTAAVAFAAHNFPDETMTQRRDRILNNAVTLDNLSNKVASGGVLNLRKIVDTDEDSLPDWWEMDHFSTLSYNNAQDFDNDGYTNHEEFLCKTNPLLASDTPNFKEQSPPLENLQINDTTLEFNFVTYPRYQYTIESSDSLGNSWEAQTTFRGDGTPLKATISDYKPEGKNQTFYRLKATE